MFETHITRTEDSVLSKKKKRTEDSASIENQTKVENETETDEEILRHIEGVEKQATIV